MKIEIYGDSRHGYHGSGESTPEDIARLLPCPFCGGRDLSIVNTHSPAYWVTCVTCNAEKHCDNKIRRADQRTKASAFAAHEAAAERAIAGWNTRAKAGG